MDKAFVGVAAMAGALLIGGVAWPVFRDETAHPSRSIPSIGRNSHVAGQDAAGQGAFVGKTAQAATATISQ